MKHLTSTEALSDDQIRKILTETLRFDAAIKNGEAIQPKLAGLLQFNLFYENSTRTHLSFKVAGQRLGADVTRVPVATSSIQKGESLRDTVMTIAALGAHILVLRASGAGTIDAAISALTDGGFETGVVNAGEGAFGHPSQALLDAATLLRAFGRDPEKGLGGLTIAIVGDLEHSRVASSCAPLFGRLGAQVRLCAPDDLLPARQIDNVSSVTTDRNEALDGADVVMTLRIQKERFETEFPMDFEAYRRDYGISMEALSFAKPSAFVMHPGPMNRGVEIDGDVADDWSRSLVTKQVAMGVPTRMAILRFVAGR